MIEHEVRAAIPGLGLVCYGGSEEEAIKRLGEGLQLLIDYWQSKGLTNLGSLIVARMKIAKAIEFSKPQEHTDGRK